MKHSGSVLGIGNDGTVIDCQACGFAHLDLLPTQAEMLELYQDHYYQAYNAGFTHKAHQSHFDEQQEDIAWHIVSFKEQLDALDSMVPKREILDYGAGCGFFAEYVRGKNWSNARTDKPRWRIAAIEPSPAARQYAKEVVKTYVAERLPDKKHKWGAIRVCYVLEHLVDPRETLLMLREHLLDKGILCIIIPNEFNSWACQGRDKFGLDSYWVRPGLHLNYFTHESIARLLRDTGYEIIDQLATFPTELFMLGGLDFASDPDLGHRLHHLRMDIELTIDGAGFGAMKLELYRWLAKKGLGRASVTYARKGAG